MRPFLGCPGRFPTPLKAGAVRVVGAEDAVLQLRAKDGSVFQFDVDGLRFR